MSKTKNKTKKESVIPEVGSNKKDKHPKQHIVNVIMTDKTEFQILTTWGKEGDTLRLDVDPKNHPAWQDDGKVFVNTNDERVTKFKKKFGDFNF